MKTIQRRTNKKIARIRASIVVATLLISPLLLADIVIFNIDKVVKAVFPSQPQPAGIFEFGKYKSKGYIATDEINIISYQSSYSINDYRFKDEDIPIALKYFAQGHAMSHNLQGHEAKISHLSVGTIEKHLGAYYTIEWLYKGFTARTFNIVVYNAPRFITWSIQDIPGLSKQDGQELFNAYVQYFEPLPLTIK